MSGKRGSSRLARVAPAVAAAVGVVVAALVLSGCGAHPAVARLVDGKPITSRPIEAAAYDAYLRGAIAESSGKVDEALDAFETASHEDALDPDIWTRIGSLRCRTSTRDPAGVAALEHALRLDPTYGPAYVALGTCEQARGHVAEGQRAFARAVAVDPGVASAAAVARHDASATGRAALLAITERRGDDPAAWMALAEWSRGHGDALLYQRALSRALQRDVAVREQVARGAEWLADIGYDEAARALAGEAADRVDDPVTGRRDPLPALAALLAVDDAIIAGDTAQVARRLVEVRVPVLVAGLRARLLGKLAVVKPLLARLVAADPAEGKTVTLLEETPAPSARSVKLLAQWFPDGGARGDDLIDAAFADAAARGLTGESGLSAAAKLELSARRQLAPAPPTAALDACHRLLALALLDPRAPTTAQALQALGRSPDRLVAVAAARVALATNVSPPTGLDAALAPFVKAGDPLALAAALELVTRRHDAPAAARLRSALAAVAATESERKVSAPD